MDWSRLTIHEARTALRSGAVTASALVDAYLARIAAHDPGLNAYLTVAGSPRRTRSSIAAAWARADSPATVR